MPVIHSEEGAAGPVSRLLELRLNDVQDDRDAVLVVVADDALMRVGCIGSYHAVALAGELSRLVGLHESYDRRVQLVHHSGATYLI